MKFVCEWPNGSVRAAEAAQTINDPAFVLSASCLLLVRLPQLCVVLRIFNRLKPCYHCPFLYDDAEEAVVEGLDQVQKDETKAAALKGGATRTWRTADPSSAAASVGMTVVGGVQELFNTRWRD
jgi:hypothetical protein